MLYQLSYAITYNFAVELSVKRVLNNRFKSNLKRATNNVLRQLRCKGTTNFGIHKVFGA